MQYLITVLCVCIQQRQAVVLSTQAKQQNKFASHGPSVRAATPATRTTLETPKAIIQTEQLNEAHN